jgi:hypothetical protein
MRLTEGPMTKVLQSAGTNAKQKKVQGSIPKYDQSAGTKHTFKPYFFSKRRTYQLKLLIFWSSSLLARIHFLK